MVQEPVESVLDCTAAAPEDGEIISELIDLTPDAAPELQSSSPVKDPFRLPFPASERPDPIRRRPVGTKRPHRRAERGRLRSAAAAPGAKVKVGATKSLKRKNPGPNSASNKNTFETLPL